MQKVRLINYAWGKPHLDELLHYSLASALAPNNLPCLCERFDCSVAILTESKYFDYVRQNSIARAVHSMCELELIPIDDLLAPSWQYGMVLSHALHRGVQSMDHAPDTYFLFLNSDFVLADGSYRNLMPRILSEERVHLAPSYCVNQSAVEPILRKRLKDDRLSIPNRELASIIIDNRHSTVRAKTINQDQLEFEHMDQFYWMINERAVVARQMPIALVGLRPEVRLAQPTTFWDWGLVYDFCPSRQLHVLPDSDEFLMLELRDDERSLGSVRFGRTSPKEIAGRMQGYITQYQVDNSKFRLFLHSDDVDPDVYAEAQQQLDVFAKSVISALPSKLPSHLDHGQWNYHKTHYAERLSAGRPMPRAPKRSPSHRKKLVEKARNRALSFGDPYKSPAVRELLQNLTFGRSVLIVGDEGSPLVTMCARSSLAARVSADFKGQSVLRGGSMPKFDVVVIDLSTSKGASLKTIFGLVCPHLAAENTVVFAWGNRTDLPIQEAIGAIYGLLSHWRLDFQVHGSKGLAAGLRLLALSLAYRPIALSNLPFIATGVFTEILRSLASRLLLRNRSLRPAVSDRADVVLVQTSITEEKAEQISRSSRMYRLADRSGDPYSARSVDLLYEGNPAFTKWITHDGLLDEPFIAVDVGVFGDHSPRWDFFGDHLILYGFDVIEEEIEALRIKNFSATAEKHYHCLAIGAEDKDTEIYFDPLIPTNTSLGTATGRITRKRPAVMRRLDSLLEQGVIKQPDFIKVDVEGAEGGVLAGAAGLIRGGVLGAEMETNFDTSDEYPQTHFLHIQNLLLAGGLKVADLNFDRMSDRGRVTTFNVLFCNSLEADPSRPWRLGQILKLLAIYELYGLGDTAVDVAKKFQKQLGARIDLDRALFLLSGGRRE